MKQIGLLKQRISSMLVWFNKQSLIKKSLIIIVLGGILFFGYRQFAPQKSQTVQYQTEEAQKGTLVVSVSSSGQVSSTNNSSISTKASGVVSKVYVSNGDTVSAGDAIAEISLDQSAKQQYSQALASYQSAKNTLTTAQNKQYSLQATMFQKWDSYKNLAENGTYQNEDGSPNNDNRVLPEFMISQDEWLAAEADYKNQQQVIAQAQTSLNSAWLSLQESSPTIYAPIDGTISGLSLQPGAVIASTGSSSSSSDSNSSSQKVANVYTDSTPTISLNLTEIDVTKVKIGDKATVTFDAFPDNTYTGTVLSIDTVGSTTSGVTNYPTVIKLDVANNSILPNMSASANIITDKKTDIIVVPTSAIETTNGISYVQVMKNGKPQQVEVEIGIASDTQTEIVSGISEGDTIVINSTSSSSAANNRTSSAFSSGFGGARMMR